MSHHGSAPFGPQQMEAFKRLQKEIGPTGEFPAGKIATTDEGALKFAVVRHGQKVMMSFGTPVEWIGFGPDEAVQLALTLVRHAGEAKGVPVTLRIGRDEDA